MVRAAAWVNMCQPSATSAIEPKIDPATISATIMTPVSATTDHVRRSVALVLLAEKNVLMLLTHRRNGYASRFLLLVTPFPGCSPKSRLRTWWWRQSDASRSPHHDTLLTRKRSGNSRNSDHDRSLIAT